MISPYCCYFSLPLGMHHSHHPLKSLQVTSTFWLKFLLQGFWQPAALTIKNFSYLAYLRGTHWHHLLVSYCSQYISCFGSQSAKASCAWVCLKTSRGKYIIGCYLYTWTSIFHCSAYSQITIFAWSCFGPLLFNVVFLPYENLACGRNYLAPCN